MERILVVAAHPDDEILGCGGTIRRFVDNGFEAYTMILSDGTTSRHNNLTSEVNEEIKNRIYDSKRACDIIGFKEAHFCKFADNCFDRETLLSIVKSIEEYVERIRPSIIYTHHYGDLNIDHQRTFDAVQTATRPFGNYPVKEIYCFETFSATEWNFVERNKFVPNYFVNIEKTLAYKWKL